MCCCLFFASGSASWHNVLSGVKADEIDGEETRMPARARLAIILGFGGFTFGMGFVGFASSPPRRDLVRRLTDGNGRQRGKQQAAMGRVRQAFGRDKNEARRHGRPPTGAAPRARHTAKGRTTRVGHTGTTAKQTRKEEKTTDPGESWQPFSQRKRPKKIVGPRNTYTLFHLSELVGAG